MTSSYRSGGFALISTFLLLVLLSALLGAYLLITRVELATTKSSADSAKGLFAAEAGLNLRAANIRGVFEGYNTPSGVSPASEAPCEGSNLGSGAFACQFHNFNNREVMTYVTDHQAGTDPPFFRATQGTYQGLNVQDFTYTTSSRAKAVDGRTEALLELRFTSRLVPMFQFAAFYANDLEILPGPVMTINGRVQTNANLYTQSGATVTFQEGIYAAGQIYRGRKNDSTCIGNSVKVLDPSLTQIQLVPSCPNRTLVNSSNRPVQLTDRVQWNLEPVGLPPVGNRRAAPGNLYFDRADLRLALRVNASDNPIQIQAPISSGIEVRNADNSPNWAKTQMLYDCAGDAALPGVRRNPFAGDNAQRAVGTSKAFRDNRENRTIRMLDVDIVELFNCLHQTNWLGEGKTLADRSDGGLVFHFTVDGPNSNAVNNYGIRVRNGATLQASVINRNQAWTGSTQLVYGLTIVSDQAIYLQGSYNNQTAGSPPSRARAAIMGDAFNVLSNAWWNSGTATFNDNLSTQPLANRIPTNTAQATALLAGTNITTVGNYNGGLENYPRFHEKWSGFTYTYTGSFVSLDTPVTRNGAWVYGGAIYEAPNRVWSYDTSFDNAANLPPLTPRFVYLKQELFVRDFEQ